MTICQFSSDKLLVGLQRVGVIGLREAIQRVEKDGVEGREAIVDALLAILARRNYIPQTGLEEYRKAVWREWLRHHGEDLSEVFSEVPVTVRGEEDERRDELVRRLESVLADLELRPVVTLAPAAENGSNPQIVIDGETLVRGLLSRAAIRAAIHRSISDW